MLSVIVCLFANLLSAQIFCSFNTINFDFENSYCDNFYRDSILHHSNSWQIAAPQKTVFTAAHSPQHVIVTDSLNHYPVNDTSVFYYVETAEGGYQFGHTAILSGYYFVDSDSLNDYGTMEVSPDNGATWIDVLNPGIYSQYMWWNSPVPVLTGRSNGWQYFTAYLSGIGPQFNVQYGDTIRYRFAFLSDSIPEYRDGLMFDDFHFEDWVEGIEEFSLGNIHTSVTPNPAHDFLNISFENPGNENFELKVYDVLGNVVFSESSAKQNAFELDVSQWKTGIYYYSISDEYASKAGKGKFVVSE